MKQKNRILDNIVGYDIYSILANNPEDYLSLYEKRFDLSDLNISSRVLNYWKDCGLLPDEENTAEADQKERVANEKSKTVSKKRNRFNFVELIYVYILQDLREFGLSIPKLRNVKTALLFKSDLLVGISQLKKEDINILKKHGFDTRMAQELFEHKEEIADIGDSFPDPFRYATTLSYAVFAALISKVDLRILITKEGDVSIELSNSIGQVENTHHNQQPHIVLPIYKYLMYFLSIEKYNELYVSYNLLDAQEMLILNHVRSGKYIEIKINFNKKDQVTMELLEEFKADNAARLQEIFLKGEYQDLQIKTQKGVINYSTIKTKKKI